MFVKLKEDKFDEKKDTKLKTRVRKTILITHKTIIKSVVVIVLIEIHTKRRILDKSVLRQFTSNLKQICHQIQIYFIFVIKHNFIRNFVFET